MPLDEQSVDKTIKAVGKKYGPAAIDRSALRRAIEESEKGAEIIAVYRRGARAQKLRERLKQFRVAAKQLAAMLEVNDDASRMIESFIGEWPRAMVSRLSDHVEALEKLNSEALAAVLRMQRPSRWGNPNANAWLAGVELPLVFEEHFGRPPGISRSKTYEKGSGPCVRFIESTMLELGKRYSTASILRAMTQLRGLRDSRSHVRRSKAT
jgi:hypothetical protein